jgi:tetratricopeptide (TPR) repeat protein
MRVGVAGVAAVVLAAAPARADDAMAPWVAGVSESNKAAAQKLVAQGNELFVAHKYAEALDAFKQAIASWDHPATRFQIVRCLIQLERPVEAAENLDLALKYGPQPLEDAVYAEAVADKKLLATQVGELEIQCTQPGVKISLDGQPVLDCPGSSVRRVKPGHHQVVGEKAGLMTTTSDAVIVGGVTEHLAVQLVPTSRNEVLVHRWPTWVPWVVFGGGFALVGSGIALDAIASARMHDYDSALVSACGTKGCSPGSISQADADLRSSALALSAAGTTTIIAGAATVITGSILLYMNRGRIVYRDVEVAPMRGGAAVTLTLPF